MVMQPIEDLKTKFTDQYVKVDPARPELARFRDVVGQVKTVNMSGRALVEFLDYHLNIGWFDIDLGALTVVDKPAPKAPAEKKAAEPKKAAPKPPAGEAASAASPPKPAPATGGKPSTSDILAKLRGGGGTPAASAPATPKPAAPKAGAPAAPAAAPAKVDRSKMSVADMMAAARANKASAAGEPASAASAPAAPAPAAAPPAPEPPAASGEIKRVDKTGMSIADIVAYCRKVDAK